MSGGAETGVKPREPRTGKGVSSAGRVWLLLAERLTFD